MVMICIISSGLLVIHSPNIIFIPVPRPYNIVVSAHILIQFTHILFQILSENCNFSHLIVNVSSIFSNTVFSAHAFHVLTVFNHLNAPINNISFAQFFQLINPSHRFFHSFKLNNVLYVKWNVAPSNAPTVIQLDVIASMFLIF